MMSFAKLRGRIVERYGTQAEFSRAVGLSRTIVNKKLTGKCGFSAADVQKWCRLLGISQEEIGIFFFDES